MEEWIEEIFKKHIHYTATQLRLFFFNSGALWHALIVILLLPALIVWASILMKFMDNTLPLIQQMHIFMFYSIKFLFSSSYFDALGEKEQKNCRNSLEWMNSYFNSSSQNLSLERNF